MPDYPRCRTCKWWGDLEIFGAGRQCRCPMPKNAEMIDDDGSCNEIITGPDFGCIHHEAKP